MADPTFLKELAHLKQSYKHTPRSYHEVHTLLGGALESVGKLGIKSSVMPHYLRGIAKVALDGLAAENYNAVFLEAERIHAAKNAGYAGVGATDPWANFRMSEWFGVNPLIGCLIRMTDKYIRIKNLTENPKADQVNESIKDTLFDLAVYSVIAICLWSEMFPTPERNKIAA